MVTTLFDTSIAPPLSGLKERTWSLDFWVRGHTGMQWTGLNRFPFRIGRQPDSGLCINTAHVSRAHAEIRKRDEQLWIRDLDSSNGTFVNGERLVAECPLDANDVVHIGDVELIVRCFETVSNTTTKMFQSENIAQLTKRFRRLLAEESFTAHFQPIVNLRDQRVEGYEALGRGLPPLESPADLFAIAVRLGFEVQLSELLRRIAMALVKRLPGSGRVFLNMHPAEMNTDRLLDSVRLLRDEAQIPPISLEIHEGAVAEPTRIVALRDGLEELRVGMTYDDFGAGQARLLELVEVPPEYLKFDRTWVQRIHNPNSPKRKLLHRLIDSVHELGIHTIAEGIESADEAEACRSVGFEFAQGFYFQRPAPIDVVLASASC